MSVLLMENCKLILGDCLEKMKELPDKSVDLVLCDLPYGTTACHWDELIDMEDLWTKYKKVIADNGVLIFTASQPFTSFLVLSNPNWFSHELIWEKEQGVNFLTSNNQPMKIHENILVFRKPTQESRNDLLKYKKLRNYFYELFIKIGLKRLQIKKEIGEKADHCFRFSSSQWSLPTRETYLEIGKRYDLKLRPYVDLKKEYREEDLKYNLKSKYAPQKSLGKPYISGKGNSGNVTGNVIKLQTKNVGSRLPTSIIRFKRETGLHPTQKPVGLFEYLIKTYSNEGNLVLDNCMGSGTTGVASLKLQRKFIGIEINPEYFEIAKKRIEECQKQQKL